ncbi:MAG: copper transporter [Fimbriimonadales bacterium]|nr:copper transporter [Fimbriimonadales bacterium]
MSDWRYHVASLSAVLLGIAVGLLIGGLYLSPAVPDQIAAQLKRLDEQLMARTAELRQAEAERENLKQALARTDSLLERLLPHIAPRRLKGKRIALLITTNERSVAQGIERLLTDAGAELVSTTRVEWWRIEPEEQTIILNNLSDLFNPSLFTGARTVLSRRRGVSLSGDYSRSADALVWVGGYTGSDAREEWLQSDSELMAALQSALRQASNAPRPVACESFNAHLSITPMCKAAEVPSVDCADLALGKSILLLLLDGESGNYGLKPTADAPFPDALLELLR